MIVVIGTTTVDLFVYAPERAPAHAGDEFTTSNLAFCDEPLSVVLGGNGANSAYAAARLGAPVALSSAIGRDALGEVVTSWLVDAGVDTRTLVQSTEHATSTTTIIMDNARNRQSFHHAGAPRYHAPEDLPGDILGQATALLVTAYPLLRQWRPDGIQDVLASAKAKEIITALDIGPAITPPATLPEIAPLLPYVDYFLANTYELGVCTGTTDIDVGMQQLIDAGANCVIVKCGRDGALIRNAEDDFSELVPGFPVETRSTVGAGDSFDAGLLVALLEERSLPDAVRFANAVASRVVAAAQGALGCPSKEEVIQWLGQSS